MREVVKNSLKGTAEPFTVPARCCQMGPELIREEGVLIPAHNARGQVAQRLPGGLSSMHTGRLSPTERVAHW